MSADLRLSDLMNSDFQQNTEKQTQPVQQGLTGRMKWILVGIIAAGALGGSVIAYLMVSAPDRPEVDTSGVTMDWTLEEVPETTYPAEYQPVTANHPKFSNPNIICNYFNDHPPETADHPLDPTITVAKMGLEHGRKTIQDYSVVMHKRERINGKLATKEVIQLKICYNEIAEGMKQSPMSVYLKFLAPEAMKGREVIWQKGRNKDKLTVHEYTALGNIQLNLPVDGMLAMRGNRYPMTEIGFETLVLRMIEKGTRDRQHEECDVKINRMAEVSGRECTMIKISHPVKRDHFEFHMAKIFIDDQYNIPLRYAAYSWPEEEGGEPVLEEEYTFTDIKMNVGLEEIDFDTSNPEYDFRK